MAANIDAIGRGTAWRGAHCFGRPRSALLHATSAVACAALSLALVTPRSALACGGCFSPVGPNLVVQDAERVLFHRDPGTGKTTVMVEVRYSGPAADFAWVLPLPKAPTVAVGSSYIFDRLDQVAAPRFTTIRGFSTEGCDFDNAASSSGLGCGSSLSADEAGGSSVRGAKSAPRQYERRDGVMILDANQAGPYDYVVIKGNTADDVLKWLNKNKFDTPAKALPILDAHVSKGDVFVAFRLSSAASIAQIRPIVLTMQDSDPCVPLRLTSIAAAAELAVVVYTIGGGRAVPKNHLEVEVNPLRLRWDGGVENYNQVVADAIDAAAGRAFVTEFAAPAGTLQIAAIDWASATDRNVLYGRPVTRADGATAGDDVIPTAGVSQAEAAALSVWRAGAVFQRQHLDLKGLDAAKTAGEVAAWLAASRFAVVDESAATLEQFTGLAAANNAKGVREFWTRVRLQVKGSPWLTGLAGGTAAVDGASLATELKIGIVEPIFLIDDALSAQGSWLTRMHMRISAAEMDRDPMFGFHATLPAVSIDWQATLTDVCTRSDRPYEPDAVRLTLTNGPFANKSWLLSNRAIDFDANSKAQRSTLLTAATSQDARWEQAPTALRVAVLEEQGPPKLIAPKQIALVDGAIAGAEPGVQSLPATIVLEPAAPWAPPASDAHAQLQRDAEGAAPSDGCTGGGPAGRALGWLALLALAATTVVARRRRGLADAALASARGAG